MPPTPLPERRPTPDAAQAIAAVARLTAAAAAGADLQVVRESLVTETRNLVGVRSAALLAVKDGGKRAIAVAGDAHGGVQIAAHPLLSQLVGGRTQLVRARRPAVCSDVVHALFGPQVRAGSALLLRVTLLSEPHILALADPRLDALGREAVAVVQALSAAGADALLRGRAATVDARRAARQSALTRAAKTLNASLDLETVLSRICFEATRILDGDHASVYRGTPDGLVMEAGYGMAPEIIGYKLARGEGLAGKVLVSGRPMLTNDYPRISGLPPNGPFGRVRSAVAVPMRWAGDLRGVIAVGYVRPFEVGEDQLTVLETFAELATVACTNASAHAGLALAARTDGLTGCLNHAALHESLQRETERAERGGGAALSLIMFDIDDFKSVNELHGHLVGDEVLRRAGRALREVTRPYDFAARYGGDEFSVLCVEADEDEAHEIARRAIDRVSIGVADLCPEGTCRATAGVAEWVPGLTPTALIAAADRALLYGKHEGGRGDVVPASSVPAWFRPARFSSTAQDADAHLAG